MRHIAIIGSGPAGYYTAEACQKTFGDDVRIDIIDRLPVPFGLIRTGVAPDHQSIKGVSRRYEAVAVTENVRFVGINVAEMDAFKHAAIPVVADARAALDELQEMLAGFSTSADYRAHVETLRTAWVEETDRVTAPRSASPMVQAEVISVVNQASESRDVVVCAAGSLPGELHKLWRTRDPRGYHLEYGYFLDGVETPADSA